MAYERTLRIVIADAARIKWNEITPLTLAGISHATGVFHTRTHFTRRRRISRPQVFHARRHFTWRSHISLAKQISQIPWGSYFTEKSKSCDLLFSGAAHEFDTKCTRQPCSRLFSALCAHPSDFVLDQRQKHTDYAHNFVLINSAACNGVILLTSIFSVFNKL